jgi:hypothetical protein
MHRSHLAQLHLNNLVLILEAPLAFVDFCREIAFTEQGCQMVYFQTKNPNLGHFCRVLQWKMLVYFMDIWSILRTIGLFYGHLVYFTDIWSILRTFGLFYRHLVYFTDIWSILRTFGLFYGHLVYSFPFWWYIFLCFGMLYQEKSGNPVSEYKNTQNVNNIKLEEIEVINSSLPISW